MSYRSSRRWVRVRRWWFWVFKKQVEGNSGCVYLVSQYGERSAAASISLLGPCSWGRSVSSSYFVCHLLSTDVLLRGGWIKWMENTHPRAMFRDENPREWKSSPLDIHRRHFGPMLFLVAVPEIELQSFKKGREIHDWNCAWLKPGHGSTGKCGKREKRR